jgi:hypothetical protein
MLWMKENDGDPEKLANREYMLAENDCQKRGQSEMLSIERCMAKLILKRK